MARTFIYMKACFIVCLLQGFSLVIKAQQLSEFISSTHRNNGPGFFVNATATGGNNGLAWQDAYTSLTIALQMATAGDTIRVAAGTYKPAGEPFILKDSVVILGGYPATGEPSDADRQAGLNQTILSGETGNPDFVFDNLSNILSGTGLHHASTLDGFIIEKGFANNTLIGVGLHLVNSDPVIRNCVFRDNSSYNSSLGGSSIACFNDSDPEVTNCFFVNNFDLGFGTAFVKLNSKPRFINCVFAANDGRCVLYANQSELMVLNCTLFKNQLGNAAIPFNIRPGFLYGDNGSVLSVTNTIFSENKFLTSPDTTDISLNNSIVNIQNSITQNYSGGMPYLQAVNPRFLNVASIAGPDNLYFTADDGLQLEGCSPAIDQGNSAAVAGIATDLLLQPRIYNSVQADIGAYEYQLPNAADILSTSGDSIVANREYTDQFGWTNYYRDCQLLLSIKKNGQQIGTINDGHFLVVIKTAAGYGSGNGTDLSQAMYVSPGISWTALNRSWSIRATTQPSDSLRVRFPWSSTDLLDAADINPSIWDPKQLVFYTVDSPYGTLDTATPINAFHASYNGNAASLNSWVLIDAGMVKYAEYYVRRLNSGSIGTGSGAGFGPFAASNSGCIKTNRKIIANMPGDLYQWQVNSGSGFVNIEDGEFYSGTFTSQLTVIEPASATYGRVFRCRIIQGSNILFTTLTVLRFEAYWKGTVSSNWHKSDNWSCDAVPDENTDVFIGANPAFAPEVSEDASCRSVHLLPGSRLTLMEGKTLTIAGHQ